MFGWSINSMTCVYSTTSSLPCVAAGCTSTMRRHRRQCGWWHRLRLRGTVWLPHQHLLRLHQSGQHLGWWLAGERQISQGCTQAFTHSFVLFVLLLLLPKHELNLFNALCGTSISHPQHYSTGGGHAPPPPPLCLHQHHTFLSYSQVATVQYIHDVATPCVLVLTKNTFITQVSLYYLNIHSLATKCILCWFILISVFHFNFSIHWFNDNWSGTQCAVCNVQCGR